MNNPNITLGHVIFLLHSNGEKVDAVLAWKILQGVDLSDAEHALVESAGIIFDLGYRVMGSC